MAKSRSVIREVLAEEEDYIVRATALLDPDADCSSIEEEIDKAKDRVSRLKRFL